jgi:hypothetical protein
MCQVEADEIRTAGAALEPAALALNGSVAAGIGVAENENRFCRFVVVPCAPKANTGGAFEPTLVFDCDEECQVS